MNTKEKPLLLKTYGGDPIHNIALEEVLLKLSHKLGRTIFRIWIQDKTVVIGYSLKPFQEVDREEVEKRNIPVVRRQSGGGAVYHDLGNINLSVYIPTRILNVSKIYSNYSKYIIKTLENLSLKPYIENMNDIVLNGYKVSGSSIWIKSFGTLYHATLLVEADIHVLKKVLKPPIHLVEEGKVTPSKYNPTNLRDFVDIDVNRAVKRLIEAIEELEGGMKIIKLDKGIYTMLNEALERYLNKKWLIIDGYRGEPPYNLL